MCANQTIDRFVCSLPVVVGAIEKFVWVYAINLLTILKIVNLCEKILAISISDSCKGKTNGWLYIRYCVNCRLCNLCCKYLYVV